MKAVRAGQGCSRERARPESACAHFLISLVLVAAEQLQSMLSSYGRHSLPPAFQPDRNSFQSAPSSASSGLSPHTLSSLLTSHFSSASILPRPQSLTSNQETETNQPQFPTSPYHPAAFASYQNSLKLKKKKHRTTKIGPDGIPLKRKSREGGTTYLWEFLLKLLQVCFD